MFWQKKAKETKKASFGESFFSLAAAVGVALIIRWALIEAYVIPSGSMLPTLLIHDHIFVNKLVYGMRVPFATTWLAKFKDVEKGEIIVFRYPQDPDIFFIKRVIGIAGDKILHDDQGRLFVNDQLIEREAPPSSAPLDLVRDFELGGTKASYDHLSEKYFGHPHSILLRRDDFHKEYGPEVVPEGYLFVMGDNRDNSNDSRYWGFVPYENVLGRAMFVWLSCEETLPVLSFLCNPLTLRWGRFFHSVK